MKSEKKPWDKPRLLALYCRDEDGYLRLPTKACREVGSATKTLAVMADSVGRQTCELFASAVTIAKRAYLPVKTVRRHLDTLENSGWIQNRGRKNGRRTATYFVRQDALRPGSDYIALPTWWQANHGILGWEATATYAAVVSHLCKLEITADRQEIEWEEYEDLSDKLDHLWRLSIADICGVTGLSRRSVQQAFAVLQENDRIARWGCTDDSPTDPKLVVILDTAAITGGAKMGT